MATLSNLRQQHKKHIKFEEYNYSYIKSWFICTLYSYNWVTSFKVGQMNVAREHNFQTQFNNPIFSDNNNQKSFPNS